MDTVDAVTRRLQRDRYHDDLAQAEAVMRAADARASVLAQEAAKNPDAFGNYHKEAIQAANEATKKAIELRDNPPNFLGKDPEGTRRPYADKSGNWAANAEVANAGGIGVDSSNTNVETGQRAQTADEAGEESPAVVAVIDKGGSAVDPSGRPLVPAGGDDEHSPARRGRRGRRSRASEEE